MKLKKLLKPYFLIPLIVLIAIIMLFVVWAVIPSKTLDIAVLDKTVPAASSESEESNNAVSNYYRKHSGLFWTINQQKYVKSDDKRKYDENSDYFGAQIDDNGQITSNKELSDIDYTPDLLYLSDVYGSELYKNKYKGLSEDDMGVVSLAHSSGATVIAEKELFISTKNDSVNSEIKKMCSITTTGWSGRYVTDLSDLSDVPEWAPPDYEEQYGVEWKFNGPGIILVNESGSIIVLEEKTDFNSKNLLTIKINDEYKKEFSSVSKSNFYNWFDLVKADSSTEEIASYNFDLNATGMEKIKDVSSTSTFVAITRKKAKNEAPVYYFAGDFCDYIQKEKVNKFCFADKFYKMISFDKSGDVSNFYWKFYNPLMKNILKETYQTAKQDDESKNNSSQSSKIENDSFQVLVGNKWQDFSIKGFNINPTEPGETSYSRNYSFYKDLISQLVEMGGNCIRAKDILPPEFYRAIYDNNKNSSSTKVYIVQTISSNLPASELTAQSGINDVKKQIEDSFVAIHGGGKVVKNNKEMKYVHNVSDSILAYQLDLNLNKDDLDYLNKNFGKDFSGKYLSSKSNSINSYLSYFGEYFYETHQKTYNYIAPLGIKGETAYISTAFWNSKNKANCYNINDITVNDNAKQYFYSAYSANMSDALLKTNEKKFQNYSDAGGKFAYGAYVKYIKSLQQNHPTIIDSFGLSTGSKSPESTEFDGVAETTQGDNDVRMLDSILVSKYLGGFISDLNDDWNAVSSQAYPYTVSIKNNALWHNVADPAQNTGIIAEDANEPKDVGLEFSDFEVMKKIQLATNPEYLYVTVMLDSKINFDSNELFLGFDTYQRNDGEYLFNKNYYANSLSGMEYIVKIKNSKTAELYVASSYDRSKNSFSSKESYKGNWNLVSTLNYGNFTTGSAQFYVASTNIRLRIPWSLLNFTDPSQKLVVNQTASKVSSQIKTTSTNGIIFYMYLGNKEDKDTDYIFPVSKQSTGYKTFKWDKWETVDYSLRRKSSFTIFKSYFQSY